MGGAPAWAARRAGRPDYDGVLRDGLPGGLLVVAVLFAALAAWHPLALPGRDGLAMAGVAGSTAGVAAGLSLLARRRGIPAGRHHAVATGVALLALANCAVQYALTQQSFLIVNVLLVVIGTGICLVDPRWVAGTVAACIAGWVGVVGAVAGAADAVAALPNCGLAVGMAVLANTTRVGALRGLLATQAELRALSQRDDLTGLLNRRGFLDAAQGLLDRGRQVRLWFVDVDGLKQVNDARGHDVGDVLLVTVATALREVFAGSVVARLSGDEFAVVEDHGSSTGATGARAALDARLALAGRALTLPVSVSAGSALSSPRQPLSALLAAADTAMYADKQARRPASERQCPAALDGDAGAGRREPALPRVQDEEPPGGVGGGPVAVRRATAGEPVQDA